MSWCAGSLFQCGQLPQVSRAHGTVPKGPPTQSACPSAHHRDHPGCSTANTCPRVLVSLSHGSDTPCAKMCHSSSSYQALGPLQLVASRLGWGKLRARVMLGDKGQRFEGLTLMLLLSPLLSIPWCFPIRQARGPAAEPGGWQPLCSRGGGL